jgi:hypothetical protein
MVHATYLSEKRNTRRCKIHEVYVTRAQRSGAWPVKHASGSKVISVIIFIRSFCVMHIESTLDFNFSFKIYHNMRSTGRKHWAREAAFGVAHPQESSRRILLL